VEDFIAAKFYIPHALAGDNYCIWIRMKMLVFSVVLSTLSPYHIQLNVALQIIRWHLTTCIHVSIN